MLLEGVCDIGNYRMARGYKSLNQDSWMEADTKWKMIWRVEVPQRIRQFLWLCMHGIVLTNEERCKRGLTDDGLCYMCDHILENIDHTP